MDEDNSSSSESEVDDSVVELQSDSADDTFASLISFTFGNFAFFCRECIDDEDSEADNDSLSDVGEEDELESVSSCFSDCDFLIDFISS